MASQTLALRMIKDVLRLKVHGAQPREVISLSLSVSKCVVSECTGLASAAGLSCFGDRVWKVG